MTCLATFFSRNRRNAQSCNKRLERARGVLQECNAEEPSRRELHAATCTGGKPAAATGDADV